MDFIRISIQLPFPQTLPQPRGTERGHRVAVLQQRQTLDHVGQVATCEVKDATWQACPLKNDREAMASMWLGNSW